MSVYIKIAILAAAVAVVAVLLMFEGRKTRQSESAPVLAGGRNYGIDLLRLLLMFMVCILHTLGQGGVLGALEAGTRGAYVYWFLEIAAYCAVDGFAIISGYTAVDKPRKYGKLVDMWFQAFFYSFIVTLLFTLAGKYEWAKDDIVKCIFPVTYGKFWYFTAFFALFLAIPVLNRFIFSLDEKGAQAGLLIVFALFSVMGFIGDPFVSSGGYSALWLMVLYCFGAFAKKAKLFETRRSVTLIVIWILCILVTWILFCRFGRDRLVNYVSPTIVMSGMIMVILFSRLQLKGTIISKLSPLAFGIYLFQLNQVVWNNYIGGAFVFIPSKRILIGVPYVFAFASLIFLSGFVVEFFRSRLAKALRIPQLSEKIADAIGFLIQRISVLLK